MRILLTANASYAPPRGGATRSNLIWLDHLASRGHQCRIVCGAPGEGAALEPHASIAVLSLDDPAAPPAGAARRNPRVRSRIGCWSLPRIWATRCCARRTTPRPAGWSTWRTRRSSFRSGRRVGIPTATPPRWWRESAGIVTIGRHMAAYVERALGRPAAMIHPPIYGPGPFPDFASFERGLITMLNPCAVKGISIFLEVAARLPAWRFGAVPGWGTTADDRRALQRLPNVEILPNARRIDDLLARTRLLLMPSLWYEGFGLIAMEAMLRGIPVVASDSGGLQEAKRGTGYVIPVATIERYQPVYDEHSMPRPVEPVNDPAPWVAAVRELLTDREAYTRESVASRAAASGFVSGLDAGQMEQYLISLPRSAAGRPEPASVESLSPEKRALLLQLLHRRKAGS